MAGKAMSWWAWVLIGVGALVVGFWAYTYIYDWIGLRRVRRWPDDGQRGILDMRDFKIPKDLR